MINQFKSTRREKTIRESREAEALFASMGDGAITTDEYGRITRINKPALKILGYHRTEIIGQPFLKMIKAETLEGKNVNIINRPITKAFLTGKPASGKLNYLTKQGTLVSVDINVSPLMVGNKPVGAIEVFRDITKEIEIDQMKSDFISLASHQLRTPLSAIKTYTHMLNDGYMGKLNPAQKSSLNTIINATNRMNEIISTLLNITKIESGSITVNYKMVNLEEIISEILPEIHIMADTKAINFKFNIDEKQPIIIKTDALIIKEIINNLVSNAIKYTPDNGRVSLSIKASPKYIIIEVSDNGWGIPEDAKDKVFSKFFRGSNIINKETNGTGLGLYLVKGLLDSINGKISYKSHKGKGTTFRVTLKKTK